MIKVLTPDYIAEKYTIGDKRRFQGVERTVIDISPSKWSGCSYLHLEKTT